jgi:hypothetical protein
MCCDYIDCFAPSGRTRNGRCRIWVCVHKAFPRRSAIVHRRELWRKLARCAILPDPIQHFSNTLCTASLRTTRRWPCISVCWTPTVHCGRGRDQCRDFRFRARCGRTPTSSPEPYPACGRPCPTRRRRGPGRIAGGDWRADRRLAIESEVRTQKSTRVHEFILSVRSCRMPWLPPPNPLGIFLLALEYSCSCFPP